MYMYQAAAKPMIMDTVALHFTDCAVPVEQRLGAEGEGFRIAMRTLDITRPATGAMAAVEATEAEMLPDLSALSARGNEIGLAGCRRKCRYEVLK